MTGTSRNFKKVVDTLSGLGAWTRWSPFPTTLKSSIHTTRSFKLHAKDHQWRASSKSSTPHRHWKTLVAWQGTNPKNQKAMRMAPSFPREVACSKCHLDQKTYCKAQHQPQVPWMNPIFRHNRWVSGGWNWNGDDNDINDEITCIQKYCVHRFLAAWANPSKIAYTRTRGYLSAPCLFEQHIRYISQRKGVPPWQIAGLTWAFGPFDGYSMLQHIFSRRPSTLSLSLEREVYHQKQEWRALWRGHRRQCSRELREAQPGFDQSSKHGELS